MAQDPGTKKIAVQCSCGKRLVGPASAIGSTIICPACGKRLQLGAKAKASAPPPAPPRPSAAPRRKQVREVPRERVESVECPNCGSAMTAKAVLCVQCGFDLREGQVLTRTQAAKKKAKKSGGFRLAANPTLLYAGAGALVLIAAGVGAAFMFRGGSGSTTPQASGASGVVQSAPNSRSSRPEPSKDPKDWQSSFAAFAACLTSQTVQDPTGRNLELRGGPVGIGDEGATMRWEGVLLGRDRRPIATMTMPADRKSPFGLRFTTGLPEPFVVLFAVDPARAPELIKLSYRPVRIEGKFEPEAHLVWLDRHGRVSSVVSAPPLKAGEPAKPDPPQGEDAKPLYVIWFTITRFERAI